MSNPDSAGLPPSSAVGGGGTESVLLPSYDNSLGAILIGGFISIFLYGVTCLQVFIYHQRYPRDRRSVKNFVFLIWAIDSFDAALTVQICYFYLISNYANPIAISSPVWSLKLHVLVTSVTNFIVRSLFARRIYTLSHGNKLITGSILALSVVDLVVGTIITARAFRIPTFAELTAVASLFYINFASNIAADIAVTSVLSYYLWTNRTGSRKTDSLVEKLISYTVNTGLITVIDALLGLICYATMPTTLVFIAFYLNLSKFFVNSYLASLNVRKTLLSSMKKSLEAGDDAFVSIHVSRGSVSQNMPVFHTESATGAGTSYPGVPPGLGLDLLSVPGARRDAMCAFEKIDTDLPTHTIQSNSSSNLSSDLNGGELTAVNTPVDGDESLLRKGDAASVYAPGILVERHRETELDRPEEEHSTEVEGGVEEDRRENTEKEKDLELGSAPIDPYSRSLPTDA